MSKKILIVDDSESLRIELKASLEQSNYSVIEAGSGAEGLKEAKNNHDLCLIISDYNMLGMDGISMCKKIKEMPEFAKVPILMLTTESNPKLKELGKEAGIGAWVVKPFDRDKFKNIEKIISALKQ